MTEASASSARRSAPLPTLFLAIALGACSAPNHSIRRNEGAGERARERSVELLADDGSARLLATDGPKVVARLFRPVYLWCGEPAGRSCERAAAALGVAPVLADQVPEELLNGFQDIQNDCEDERVRQIRQTLEEPLGLDGRSWADQVGREIAPGQIGQRYEGGGCITSGQRDGPTVKIHVQPRAEPPLALVRVWEPGQR